MKKIEITAYARRKLWRVASRSRMSGVPGPGEVVFDVLAFPINPAMSRSVAAAIACGHRCRPPGC